MTTYVPNVQVPGHPMIGQRLTYRPDMPDQTHVALDSNMVVRHGDAVTVLAVFHDWNQVEGLTIFYVDVPATGYRTHVSEREVGLPVGSTAAKRAAIREHS